MAIWSTFIMGIWEIFLEMAPYLLLGFLIAGILNVIITKNRITRFLGKGGLWTAVKASLIGVPLPLCSCGVIPTGISFHKNGATKGATNSFLISTPQTGVDSMLMTYSMMNIHWAIFRPIIAFITGIVGGVLTDATITRHQEKEINNQDNYLPKEGNLFFRILNYAFIEFLGDISRQLLLGILIAVIITTFVPSSFFTSYMNSPILNMLIILVASIPLYVCATGSVPIGAALLISGVSPGAVLVFLMAGPATNAATLTVLWKSLGKKATLVYLSTIIGGALLFGILIDYVLPTEWFSFVNVTGNHIHETTSWFSILSAVLLIALLIFVEAKKLLPKNYTINTMHTTYNVNGMTCNHCKASVEKNLVKLEGIKQVTADPNQNLVIVEGEADEKSIQSVIDDLGFEYKGKN